MRKGSGGLDDTSVTRQWCGSLAIHSPGPDIAWTVFSGVGTQEMLLLWKVLQFVW